ncbi:MAG: MarR family transcriptional regulator [Chlorobiota bacterium]|jgi:DNA-binding MarR family transcriptional regulator|nr:MAG: MarR family transcriptional regulator [Chlorobiota bacterium]
MFARGMSVERTNEHQFIAALERLSAVLRSLQWNAVYAEGLYPIQLQVLMLCATRQGQALSPTSLAAELNVTAPTMSDTLAALERKGFIERKPNPVDRRGVVVQLTTQGEGVLERVREWDAPLRDALMQVPLPHRELGYEAVLHLLKQLYQLGVITMPHMCFTCRWLRYDERRMTTPYYCQLLDRELAPLELRVECPEHEHVES